jgi:GT2 family glycosyltransferase
MVSIIICSRKPELEATLILNIKETIGCQYEIISIDNSLNSYSIFSAYNQGASQSKYDLLCFMHEDIMFKTINWGLEIVKILRKPTIGVIGVAGAVVKTKAPSPWWIANGYKADEYLRYNIIQNRKKGWVHEQSNPESNTLSEVAVLDGVWLCCRKDVWEHIKFDEKLFSGFHFYDLDFCLSVIERSYKNYAVHDILIEHNSTGNVNAEWLNAAEIFHEKWRHVLPISINKIKPINLSELEYHAKISYLWLLIGQGYGTMIMKLKIWIEIILHKSLDKNNWLQLYCIFKSYKNTL